MRLDLTPGGAQRGAGRYICLWPGYSASAGSPYAWRRFKLTFPCVAVYLRCDSCNRRVAILGRSLLPAADPHAIMYATPGRSVAAFQDDRDAPTPRSAGPWDVHKIIVHCGTTLGRASCTGEVQRNLDKIAERLDAMHAKGRHAVEDL